MKKITILMAVMLLCAMGANAQNSTGFISDKLMLEADVSSSSSQHHVTPIGLGVNLGYNVTNRFYAYMRCQGKLGLWKVDDTRNYISSRNLGGGLGYTFYRTSDNYSWDVRGQVTQSISSDTWKNTTYNLSIYSYHIPACRSVGLVVGLGFEWINSHTSGVRDQGGICGSVGIKF